MALWPVHSRCKTGPRDLETDPGRPRARRHADPPPPLPASWGSGLVLLGMCALSLGALAQRVHKSTRRLPAAEASFRRALAEKGDSAALRRVCHAILCEFAQPLSGVLVYSELLMQHPLATDDAQRYELRQLREGALQLERLLLILREAVRSSASLESSRLIAEHIEQAIAQPRSRMPTRIA